MKTILLFGLICFNCVFTQDKLVTEKLTVYFKSGRDFVNKADQLKVQVFLNNLGQSDTLYILGFADGQGESEFNLELSKKRIESVKVLTGNFQGQLIQKAFGESACISSKANQDFRKVDLIVGKRNSVQETNLVSALEESSRFTIIHDTVLYVVGNHKFDIRNRPIRLEVLFYLNETRMLKSSYDEVETLLNYLVDNPDVVCDLVGHVCCNNEVRLSKSRADAIKKILWENGIDTERVKTSGVGNAVPIFTNNQYDEQASRRVEVIFYDTKKP